MKKFYGTLLMIFGIGISCLFAYLIGKLLVGWNQTREIDIPLLIKLIALFSIGLFDIALGLFYRVHKVKKDDYLIQRDGHTYVKLGGSYTVGYTQSYFALWYLGFFLSIVVIIFYTANFMRMNRDINYLGFISLMTLGFFTSLSYFMYRPRIIVKEDTCIFLPRWEKRRFLSIGEITERELSKQGLFKRMFVTYYSFGQEIITLPLTLENAVRFDINVYQRLSNKKAAE